MDDKQMKQLLKLVLMALEATFAPIWIPVAVITIVPAFLILEGILSTIALGITTILTILLGVFGLPLLFSTALTGMAYLMYKAFEKISAKVKCILKQSLSELNITGRIQSWFNLKKFLMVVISKTTSKFRS
jgi:ABC-type transport system involved in cytochrome bd biosynthesis fused ATPase/permease subunit